MLLVFLFALILPPEIAFYVGPVKLPAYRLVLILAAIPALLDILKDDDNPITLIDTLYFCYVLWAVLSLVAVHGPSVWQYAGLTAIEGIVPYLLGKAYIRDENDFRRMCRILFLALLVILPLALIETFAGKNLLRDFVRAGLGQGPLGHIGGRLGLDRAFGPFLHPIHYGVFSASLLGLTLCLRKTVRDSAMHFLTVLVATFCSLSSGPLLNFALQFWLFVWEYATRAVKHRWRLLTALILIAYVTVDLLSNRTPFHVLVSYLTFNTDTAYNRIHIWFWGTISIERNPIFGIGLNEWERYPWMSTSMDNFWLLTAVRHGLPALLFMALSFAILFYRASLPKMNELQERCRTGWAFTIVAFIIGGGNVHYWEGLYCYVIFIFACGLWMTNPRQAGDDDTGEDVGPKAGTGDDVPGDGQQKTKRFVLD